MRVCAYVPVIVVADVKWIFFWWCVLLINLLTYANYLLFHFSSLLTDCSLTFSSMLCWTLVLSSVDDICTVKAIHINSMSKNTHNIYLFFTSHLKRDSGMSSKREWN